MKIFYCPKCNTYEENFKFENLKQERELTTWINPRDGYGMIIKHIMCPSCGNVLSGIMEARSNDRDEVSYLKGTIEMYNKESKDGGMINDGELKWLIDDIKRRKGLRKIEEE